MVRRNAGLNARWHSGQVRGQQVGEMERCVAVGDRLIRFFSVPQIPEAIGKCAVCSWKACNGDLHEHQRLEADAKTCLVSSISLFLEIGAVSHAFCSGHTHRETSPRDVSSCLLSSLLVSVLPPPKVYIVSYRYVWVPNTTPS